MNLLTCNKVSDQFNGVIIGTEDDPLLQKLFVRSDASNVRFMKKYRVSFELSKEVIHGHLSVGSFKDWIFTNL